MAVAGDQLGGELLGHPHKRIDGVFVGPAVEVLACEVPQAPKMELASDHRPVLAVLRLP